MIGNNVWNTMKDNKASVSLHPWSWKRRSRHGSQIHVQSKSVAQQTGTTAPL